MRMPVLFCMLCACALMVSGVVLPSSSLAGDEKVLEKHFNMKGGLENRDADEGKGERSHYHRHHWISCDSLDDIEERGACESRKAAKKKKFEEKREAIRAELMALPEDQRQERMEEMFNEMEEKHAGRAAKIRESMKERWDNATPEERKVFCEKSKERCARDAENGYKIPQPPEEIESLFKQDKGEDEIRAFVHQKFKKHKQDICDKIAERCSAYD